MYEYKVLKWRVDLSSSEELENELNKYAKEGWKIVNIISGLKGSGSLIYGSSYENNATFILEKVK